MSADLLIVEPQTFLCVNDGCKLLQSHPNSGHKTNQLKIKNKNERKKEMNSHEALPAHVLFESSVYGFGSGVVVHAVVTTRTRARALVNETDSVHALPNDSIS